MIERTSFSEITQETQRKREQLTMENYHDTYLLLLNASKIFEIHPYVVLLLFFCIFFLLLLKLNINLRQKQ